MTLLMVQKCVQKTTCYLRNPYTKNGIFSISTGYPDSWTINSVAHILCHLMSVMDWPCWVPYDSEWFLRQMTSTCFPRYCGLLGVLCWGSGRRRSPHDGGWLGTVPVFEGVETVVKRLRSGFLVVVFCWRWKWWELVMASIVFDVFVWCST